MEPIDTVDAELLIQEIVWAYSEQLDNKSNAEELARFQAVLAHMLLRSPRRELGLQPRRRLSVDHADELARRGAMQEAVQRGLGSAPSLLPLPTAIALWPLDAENRPKDRSGNRVLPEHLKGQNPRAVFRSRDDKQVYGFFEIESSDAELPMVTSSLAAVPAQRSGPENKTVRARLLAAIGVMLFVISLAGVLATGNLLGSARALVADAAAQYKESAQSEAWNVLRNELNENCKPPSSIDQGPALGGLCKDNVLEETTYATCLSAIIPTEEAEARSLTRPCSFVWAEALRLADAEWSSGSTSHGAALGQAADWAVGMLVSLRMTGADIAEKNSFSIAAYFYLSMVALVILFIAFGFGTKGRWCGLVISEQNRVSLSLSQITAWTIVLLSAYAVYAAFNVGALSGYWSNDVLQAEVSLFPALPFWTWAVMGITVGAPFASSLIKGDAPEGWNEYFKSETTKAGQAFEARALEDRGSEKDAGLGDLITSEELGKGNQLAITRVQNVIITATLLFTYTAALAGVISALFPHTILTSFSTDKAILAGFPEPEATFTALLALSHGAYLMGKFQPAGQNKIDP